MEYTLEILGKVGFDWQVALANFVSFLVVLFILWKYAFKPLDRIISIRKEKIEKGLQDAQDAEGKLENAHEEAENIVATSKDEAKAIVSDAHTQKRTILDQARLEGDVKAKELLLQAQKDISLQKESVLNEAQGELAGLVINATKKVLGDKMTPEINEAYAKQAIQSIATK